MKKLCIVVLISVICLTAGSKTTNNNGRLHDIKVHDINQIEMYVSNYGKFGQTESGNFGCFWPKYTNMNYIYGAGIWFGTVDDSTGDSLVTIGYGPHGGETEFVPGLVGQSDTAQYTMIYMYPDPWPAPLDSFPMAPQSPVSHQDSWCCMNDLDSSAHIPGDTRPIGLELYQTVYAWDTPPIEDVIFFIQEIKNVSEHTLHDCYYGVCMDNDVGNEAGASANDRCTGIVDRTYIINNDTIVVDNLGYQWQEELEPGWADFPGVIGVDLLQTPFNLVAGQDLDGDGIPDEHEDDSVYYWNNVPAYLWDVDNDGVPDWRDPNQWPQIGMTAFKRFTLNLEPDLDNERYLTLAGYNFMTQVYEPYDTLLYDPDDQRFLMASGPFDLEPDSSVTLIFAVMLVQWHNIYGTPDSALAYVNEQAQLWYDQYWFLYGIEEHSVAPIKPSIMIAPNPAVSSAYVSFTTSRPGNVSIKVYNSTGQLVLVHSDEYYYAGDHTKTIHTDGLSAGMYYVVLKTVDNTATQPLVVLQH